MPTWDQIMTWNLSALWMIPTAGSRVWLKATPSILAHEGAVARLVETGRPATGRQASRNRIARKTQIPLKAAKKSARPPVMIASSQMPVTVSIRASEGWFNR